MVDIKWRQASDLWWRCPRCDYLSADEYVRDKENPYRCFACGRTSINWVVDRPKPEDR